MTKVKNLPQRSGSRLATPYPLRSLHSKITKHSRHKKQKNASEKKEWRDAKCSVCLEYPHNAVLLLCSSHHKGCRSYMCATSYRYSNCLDQYKKAYTKVNPVDNPGFSLGSEELLCPLCRGQVKGWTVVKRARKFLNSKKRSCMQENCSFVGSYKDLRKHVRADHPSARPREVDPSLAKKWKKLENDRELDDVRSTINSTMPGSIIMGDYVIERNYRDMDYLDDVVFQLEESRNPFYESSDDEYIELPRNYISRITRQRRDYESSDDEIVGRVRNYIPRITRQRRDLESSDDDTSESSDDEITERVRERVRNYIPRITRQRRDLESSDDDTSDDEITERVRNYIPRNARLRQGRVLYGGARRRRGA